MSGKSDLLAVDEHELLRAFVAQALDDADTPIKAAVDPLHFAISVGMVTDDATKQPVGVAARIMVWRRSKLLGQQPLMCPTSTMLPHDPAGLRAALAENVRKLDEAERALLSPLNGGGSKM